MKLLRAEEWTITDFSGLSFRPGGGGVVDKLLVLTREGKAVYAMTTDGNVLERMPVIILDSLALNLKIHCAMTQKQI